MKYRINYFFLKSSNTGKGLSNKEAIVTSHLTKIFTLIQTLQHEDDSISVDLIEQQNTQLTITIATKNQYELELLSTTGYYIKVVFEDELKDFLRNMDDFSINPEVYGFLPYDLEYGVPL